MAPRGTLYQSVVTITSDYLGPAAQRFVDRQIQNHLAKQPKDITPRDLDTLIEWSRVALAVLTEDTRIVQEYIDRLETLASN